MFRFPPSSLMPTAILFKAAAQSALAMTAGAGVYYSFSLPSVSQRRWLSLSLTASFVACELWLLPAELPRGNIGAAQIAAFFLTGSAFLSLTRLIYFTVVGWDATSHNSAKPTLPKFLLLYFTAPIAVRTLQPSVTAWHRYTSSWDQPPWRVLLKAACLYGMLRYGVVGSKRQLDDSLLLFSITGNAVFYLLLSGIEDLFSTVLEPILGVQMWPSFDQPWLAVSFRDFWSYRWHSPYADTNVVVVRKLLKPYLPKPLPALFVYLYSGICHVGFVYFTTGTVSPHMLVFFALAYLGVVLDPFVTRGSRAFPPAAQPLVCRGIVITTLSIASTLFWYELWHHRFLQGLAQTCGLE